MRTHTRTQSRQRWAQNYYSLQQHLDLNQKSRHERLQSGSMWLQVQREEPDAPAQGSNTDSQFNLFWVKGKCNAQPQAAALPPPGCSDSGGGDRGHWLITAALCRRFENGHQTVRLYTLRYSPQQNPSSRSVVNLSPPPHKCVNHDSSWSFRGLLVFLHCVAAMICGSFSNPADSSFCFSVYCVSVCSALAAASQLSCGFHLLSTHYLVFFFSFGSCFIYTHETNKP